jgi:TRAP-type C4-dicarboxylate transport system substrate-binding protein
MSNHVYTPVTFVMNGEKFDSLSPEHQELVKRVALEAAQYSRDLGAKADEEFLVRLQQSEDNEVNQIDLAAFQAASEPVYAAIAESAGEELTQRVRDAARGE